MWNSTAVLLVNFALFVVPNQAPPVSPQREWPSVAIPVFMSFLQFILLSALTYYIFKSNSRQKVVEREATWYHKIVVDHSISTMGAFFKQASDEMCAACLNLHNLRAADEQAQADALVRDTLAKFKKELYAMDSDVTGRLSTFESAPVQLFTSRIEKLEDDVTKWFDTYEKAKPYDRRESLPVTLKTCQVDLLRLLKSYEFETWGWPRH